MKKKTGTKKIKTEKIITDLMKHQIGSICLTDIDNLDKMSGTDRKNYLQQAETIWGNPVFKNEVKLIIQTQLEFIAMEAVDILQVSIGRGTINGIDLISERFETLHNEYLEAKKPAEDFKDGFEV